jgi:O-antigen/teichoic acid export membrane protein
MGVAGLERIFQLGMLYLWLNGLFYLIQNQFRWELRSTNFAVVSLLVTLVTAAVAVSFAYGLKWGLTGIFLAMIGGTLIGCIYGIWNLRNSFRFCFHMLSLKEMLVFSIPLVPSGIAVFVSSYIDRMMLNHYMSLQEVGLYGVGFRLASVVGLVMVGFKGALTPLIYSHYQEAQTPRQLAAIFRLFVVLSLFVFLGLSLFSEEILHLVTIPAFYSAERVVVLLVPAVLLSNMYIFAPGIGIAKKTHLFLWINAGGALVCVGLNWLLIPVAGIGGAAGAKLLGYGAIFLTYMIFSQRLYYIPHEWWRLIGAVAIAATLAFFGKAMTGQPMFNVLTKSLLLIPFLTVIFGFDLIKRSEMVQAYRSIIQRVRAIGCHN